MCGIAGWISPAGQQTKDISAFMTKALAHRGPDARGIWQSEGGVVTLVNTRLSIIDLTRASDQPFVDDSGNFVIVFNGEIYNYKDLKKELEARGARFRTNCDTEVLLEAYKEWGPDCLQRFIGMFAFAIWDRQAKRLFLARDRIGKKPLFYAPLPEGGFAFASEPQALLGFDQIDKTPHDKALQAYLLLGYSTGEQTGWRGIKRLLPAHAMTIDASFQMRIWRYWDLLPHFQNKTTISENEAAEKLRSLLDDAVRYRMEVDVPYGVFLSGGMDSSAVLASMVARNGAALTKTFSIGFTDPLYDESGLAAKTAQHFGTEHFTFMLDPAQLDIEPILSRAALEPLADVSMIPTYEVARQTRQHVKMVLTGDGGDEMFAGYPTYVADALHRKISPFVPFMPDLPQPAKRRSVYYKLYQFLQGLPLDARRAHFSWRVFRSEKNWRNLLSDRFGADFSWEDVYQLFDPYYEEAKDLSPLDQALYVDIKTWLVDSVMVKADRATMSHGLEAAAPLLDHRIAEFAASLPEDMKLKPNGLRYHMKHILRESQRSRLPEFLFNQPKRGFSVPVSSWFNSHLKDHVADAIHAPKMDHYFNIRALQQLWDEHRNGRDHGLTLLNIILMARWLNQGQR